MIGLGMSVSCHHVAIAYVHKLPCLSTLSYKLRRMSNVWRTGITYSVTAGKSLQAVYNICGGSGHVGLSVWIIIFAVTELFASQVGALQIALAWHFHAIEILQC